MRNFKDEFFHFPVSTTFHPFKAYDSIKYENKGNLYVAIFYIVLTGILFSISYNATGFLVNDNNPTEYNGLTEFLGFVIPAFLLIIANWSVTTLMDGKGKFKEIIMVAGYSCFPFIIMYTVSIVYSNVMIMEEVYLYYLIINIGLLFSFFSMLIGLIMIHKYTLKEAILSILATVVGFIIIVFIIFLMMSLFLQIFDFFDVLMRELSQRVGGV